MFRLLLASTSANQVQQQFKEWPVDGTLQQNFTDWDLLNLMNKIMEDSGWENLRLYLSLWLVMVQGDIFYIIYIKEWTNLLIFILPGTY